MAHSTGASDWVQRSPLAGGTERIEAYFSSHGYTPHRHDTYALGLTLSGVQSFSYRRAQRHSVPGGAMVLHPDELHDGHAGTEAGFHYRMLYVAPALVQQVLGGRPLPFLEGGLSQDPRLQRALWPLLQSMDEGLQPLAQDDALYDLILALEAAAGRRSVRRLPDLVAVERVRACIHDSLAQGVTLDVLADAAGLDRWRLCRDFRALYGTSPYRYLSMRRLDAVQRLLLAGQPVAEAALQAGFFDQSHMARQFAQAHGVPPARWLRRLHRPAA